MNTTIISNKVFSSIQPGTGYTSHTGTILYANKFSGLPKVSMPDDIKKFLDSNLGSVGTNPIIQLKNKLAALPGGPWYIDCRNGILYIHNRKFNEDVVHTYTYQAENGEVISLSFETQRRTKSLGHSRGSGIDPNTKSILSMDSNVKSSSPGPSSDKPEQTRKPTSSFRVTAAIDASRVSDRNIRPDVESYATARTKVITKKNAQARSTAEKNYNAYTSGKLSAKDQFNYQVNKSSSSRKDKWARNIYVKLNPQDRVDLSTQVAEEWRKNHNRNSVMKLVRKYFGYGRHAITYPVWKEQWVDPTTYSGNNTFNGKPHYGIYLTKPELNRSLNVKVSQISKDPNIKVLSNVSITTSSISDRLKAYTMKVFRLTYSRDTVDSATIVTDWLIRLTNDSYSSSANGGKGGVVNGSGGDGSLGINFSDYTSGLSGNKGRTVTEKKLVVTLHVVGRPSLETSQIIHIDNVGTKWSGDYYVKTCTHDLSPDIGYTCTLELNKNGEKAEIESSTTKLSTEKIVEDISSTSTESYSKNRKASNTTSDSKTDKSYKRTYYSTTRVNTSKPKEPYKTKKARDK